MRPVLAGPGVGTRLAEEWQHALVQALYQCAAPERAVAARVQHDAAGAPRVPAIELKRALVEAQVAIGEGRIEPGHAALARAEPLLGPRAPRQASWWHLLQSRLDLIEGRHRQALTHARLALRLATDSGFPERWMGVTVMQEGQIHIATGDGLAAVPFFERAGRAASGAQADFCWCLAHFARALGHFSRADDAAQARSELAQGLALARQRHWLNFFRASPRVAAQVCAYGLEHEIETAFVHEVIAARRLDATRPDLAMWPWPIRVRALGRFRIDIDGAPLSFAGKVARKPLELLQFLIASGGSEISAATVMFALWRDLEGDKARSAFNVTLHRLRKLLAHDEAVLLELGRLSLNPRLVWVDTLAFEQLIDGVGPAAALSTPGAQAAQRAVAMYAGHFLNDTEDEPWQLVHRSRLASKFKRAVSQLARHGIAQGDTHAVRVLLERALELDPTAEDLARELMRVLIDTGEQAAALDVFGHCRAAIAQALAAKPSAATLALVERIRAME
jgi:DNA-binding SARP family transcriptional activator